MLHVIRRTFVGVGGSIQEAHASESGLCLLAHQEMMTYTVWEIASNMRYVMPPEFGRHRNIRTHQG
jgi:hypothetical protein